MASRRRRRARASVSACRARSDAASGSSCEASLVCPASLASLSTLVSTANMAPSDCVASTAAKATGGADPWDGTAGARVAIPLRSPDKSMMSGLPRARQAAAGSRRPGRKERPARCSLRAAPHQEVHLTRHIRQRYPCLAIADQASLGPPPSPSAVTEALVAFQPMLWSIACLGNIRAKLEPKP